MDSISKRSNQIENLTGNPKDFPANLEKQEVSCPSIHTDSYLECKLSQSLQNEVILIRDPANENDISRKSVQCQGLSEIQNLEDWTLKCMNTLNVEKEKLYDSVVKMVKSPYDNSSSSNLQGEKNAEFEEYEDEEDEEDEVVEEVEEVEDITIEESAIDPNFPIGEDYDHFISKIDWENISLEEENHIYQQRKLQIRRDHFFCNKPDISSSLVEVVTTIKMNIRLNLEDEIPNFSFPKYCSLRDYIDIYRKEIYQFIGLWNISIEDMKRVLLLARKLRLTETSLYYIPRKEIHLYEDCMNDLQIEAYRILKTFIDYYPCSYNKNIINNF